MFAKYFVRLLGYCYTSVYQFTVTVIFHLKISKYDDK